MCKVKQLNGEAPRANNYCTAREYEVLTIIAKNEELKVGDLIDGEQLSNKTAGRIWEITECNRTDGGHVTIKDNKGNVKTCMFVFGKGTQKPQPKPQPQPQTTTQEEDFYTCKIMEETAAKFAELCLAVGCTPSDIYTSY